MGVNQTWAKVIGIVLLLYGVLGLFSAGSVIMSYGNMYHNIVHLLTGAIFVWAGFVASAPTKKVNTWLGVVYALVGILGMFGIFTELMGLGSADNWFHLVIGVVSIWLGWKVE